jgi:TonB family protein
VALSGTSAPVNDGPSKGMPGKVDPGEPEIGTSTTGGAVITSIDKTPIKKVIDAHLADIESCHEGDDAGHPSQEGKVVVLFTISTKGDVSEAEIESSTVDDQDIEACIVEHVKKWTFPPPASGRPIPVRYPFSLDPSS